MLHAGAKPTQRVASCFLHEARAAAAVRRQNSVGIVDIGQDDLTGALCIVQEFLQGTDLKRRLAVHGPMAPREAIELLLPVMRALAYAHSKNVVHRDLKPDNIFLHDTPEGVVPKVIDFGIAKVTDEHGQSPQNTRTTQVLGTPYYMSPEQACGDRAVDQRSDVWSLGVVLFHTLTQRYPHEGASVNLITTNIIARQPTPITAYAPMLPQAVVTLVHGALQYDPAARLQSMESFWEAARTCLVALGAPLEPAPARSSMPARVASKPAPPSTPADFPTVAPPVLDTAPDAHPTRARNVAIGAVLTFALVAAVGGYWSGRPVPTSPPLAAAPSPPRVAPAPVVAQRPPTAPAHVRPTGPLAAALSAPPRGVAPSPVRPAAVAPLVVAAPTARPQMVRTAHDRVRRPAPREPAPRFPMVFAPPPAEPNVSY